MSLDNRLQALFARKKSGVLSVYFTAGYPRLGDTADILKAVEHGGADIAEIGMPFSDPVADGPTIQAANEQALVNGMSLAVLFEQLKTIRPGITIPVVLMGYLNPILQFGVEQFCRRCKETGIDGLILPDLPPSLFTKSYKSVFERNGLVNIFLVTPQSTDKRMREIDALSEGFVYAVSSAAVTGGNIAFDEARVQYLKRIKALNLRNPTLVGFGVSSRADCAEINKYANGVIVGSAFIRALADGPEPRKAAFDFVKGLVQ